MGSVQENHMMEYRNSTIDYDQINIIIEDAKEKAIGYCGLLGIPSLNEEWMNISIPNVQSQEKNLSHNLNETPGRKNNLGNDTMMDDMEDDQNILNDMEDDQNMLNMDSDTNRETNTFSEYSDDHHEGSPEDDVLLKELKDVNLNLVDYSSRTSENERCYVTIYNNTKEITVKKGTLCWLLDNKNPRLSTDRLERVRGPKCASEVLSRVLPKKAAATKKRKRRSSGTSTGSVSLSSPSYADSDESETFSDLENDKSAGPEETGDVFFPEKYYSVAYKENWYIGRILEITNNGLVIKFLKYDLDKYIRPQSEDIQTVEEQYVFHGPVELKGTYPFNIDRTTKLIIEKKYR